MNIEYKRSEKVVRFQVGSISALTL